MGFEEQIDEILRDAYESIIQEGLEQELEDFIKIEQFFKTQGSIDDSSTEIWYISLNDDKESVTVFNPQDVDPEEENQVLAIRYKATYGDIYTALQDDEMIHECKADKCVGIITRSEAWASKSAAELKKAPKDCDDKVSILLTTLTTPRGVHIITRQGDEIDHSTYPKSKIKSGENKLVDALVSACFHW